MTETEIEAQKHYWLYTLRLEKGKYYVGITTQVNPETRIKQHGGFLGASWCRKFKPIEVLETIDLGVIKKQEAESIENQKLYEYMDIYGFWNVRGGSVTYTGYIVPITRTIYLEGWMLNSLGTGLLLIAMSLYIHNTR